MSTQTSFAEVPFDSAKVAAIIAQHKSRPGALLPMLHDIQSAIGFIPPASVAAIADGVNLSRAEVHGVITYYHFFRQHPAGKHVVQICRAEACQARGCESLVEHAKELLGCDFHSTTDDNTFTLENVYCLGQCANGPAVQIDDDLYARVSNEKFNRLIETKRQA
jgi:formate dehydrogenase subunit gamma